VKWASLSKEKFAAWKQTASQQDALQMARSFRIDVKTNPSKKEIFKALRKRQQS